MAEPVNIHINADEFSVEHLLNQLRQDGHEITYQKDAKGNYLFASFDARIYIAHSIYRQMTIHDPTYSRDYFRIEQGRENGKSD